MKMVSSQALVSVLATLFLCRVCLTRDNCPAQVVVTTQSELKNQIREEIGYALQCFINASDQVGERLSEASASDIKTMLNTINRRLDSIEKKMGSVDALGSNPCHAASSCADILQIAPASPPGHYWVTNGTRHPHSVYCDMTRSCGGVTGGWMRVAELDMTNSGHQCPTGLRQRTDSGVRSCAAASASATCSSVLHRSHGIRYSRVCGKIIAYHGGSLDAFDTINAAARRYTINSNYVDGISLTHGQSPRQHIWTFAAGGWCPSRTPPPAFVGSDYFYDLDISQPINLNNPLWDGQNCRNQCCRFNNPPWFYKQLPQPTTDDLQMRVCRDQERANEDLAIKAIDLYVQ